MNIDPAVRIERLTWPAGSSDIRQLARLLVDTVAAGASVSFLASLTLEQAEEWWQRTLSEAGAGAVFLVARRGQEITGTVQLHPAWAPNQPHRAEVAKLMVHPSCQRVGLGVRLVQAVEVEARRSGFRLLTLDTKRGTVAEQLYLRLGWTRVGVIPGYALDPDGKALHDTVIFYKELPEM